MKKVTKINSNNGKLHHHKLKTACYVRVSTDNEDQLASFDVQVKHYTNYITSNPDWNFVGIYADSGISGTKKEIRPEFLRLLTDCESRKVDFIITKSISRFVRNTTDCLEIIRRLTELGVGVFFEKENINTLTLDSELMLSILSTLAASESTSISKNNKWGDKKRFQNGTYKLASPPYGYSYNGETLEPNEVEAQIVRRIFSELLNGSGVRAVAQKLNTEGIKPQRGEKWSSTSIRGIIKNEKMVGDALFQKTYTDDNFRRHHNKGAEDQYFVKDNHEPIISRADFEAVQLLIAQRGKEKGIRNEEGKYKKRYTFSSKIVCNECGGNFRRKICRKNKHENYIAWSCATHIDTNSKDCSMLFMKEERLIDGFLTMMSKLHCHYSSILKPLLTELKQLDSGGQVTRIQEIDNLIIQLTEQVQVITGLLSKGYLAPALFIEQKGKLQTEVDALRQERQLLLQSSEGDQKVITETENLIRYLEKTKKVTTVFDEALFAQFVENIIIFSPTEVGFKLKSGLCFKEKIER